MVLISIVIPTLNEERHVGKILRQLSSKKLRKKYPFEVIVADCHSTDKTVDIAKKYGAIVTYTRKGMRTNAARARNAGAKKATGDVLLFLDADGIIDDVDELLAATSSLVTGKYGCFNGKVDVHPNEAIWKDHVFEYCTNMAVRAITFLGTGGGRGPCLGIRRDIFNKIGGFNADLDCAEDFEIFMRARKYTKVKHFSNVILYESPRRYRVNGHFKTFNGWIANGAYIILFNKSLTRWEKVEYENKKEARKNSSFL